MVLSISESSQEYRVLTMVMIPEAGKDRAKVKGWRPNPPRQYNRETRRKGDGGSPAKMHAALPYCAVLYITV